MALTEKEVQAMNTLAVSVEPMSNAHRRGRLEMFPNVWDAEFNDVGSGQLRARHVAPGRRHGGTDPAQLEPLPPLDHRLRRPRPGGATRRTSDLGRRAGDDVHLRHGRVLDDGRQPPPLGRQPHVGFVPKNHIVGRASFIWFSKQNEAQHGEAKIRWDRMMKTVK